MAKAPVTAKAKPAVIAAGLIAAAAASTTAAASSASTPPAGAASAPKGNPAAMTVAGAARAPAPGAAPEATQPYIVRSVPIRHQGKVYQTGFEIDLTEAQALRLGALVTPVNSKDKA